MLFNSLTFVVFFVVVVALFWAIPSWGWKKNLLLVASYIFYGAWNPPFALLLLFSTFIDYLAGARMAGEERPLVRRVWLMVSLVANFGLLGFFKYGGFFVHNMEGFLVQVGIQYRAPEFDVILPVGISFYTFQTLSYTIDVYRRQLAPAASFRDFALYVAFFPQLVAGPIVRAIDFLPQCVSPTPPRAGRFGWGLFLMTLGLFQKIVLADGLLAGASDAVFGYGGKLAMLDAWIGVLGFSAQIFFDFAGYSTCAIGLALCLGFSLPDNFKFPYAAVGFSDFWRRWHISLSTWLRDYLYIPMGGNRHGAWRTGMNLVVLMFLGGLWHGAAWTFVVWGLIHGFYLVVEHTLRTLFGDPRFFSTFLAKLMIGLLTYAAVCFAWVFFRARDFGTALRISESMVGITGTADKLLSTRDILQVGIVTTGLLMAHWVMRDMSIVTAVTRIPKWALAGACAVMAFSLIITQGSSNAFIYFQF
jgi:D-alanyl-lipoteichoic acid acyltransferase DltB (MBOAT superfamily)